MLTDSYAVIGNPIAQSKSPLIHQSFAEATGQALTYTTILAPQDGFTAAVDAFRQSGGRGLNVTTPFKLDASVYATSRSQRARQAGAVNCMRFTGEQAEGENFDGIGMLRDLEVNLRGTLFEQRILVLGAGGAVRGALAPLLSAEPEVLVVANRTPSKAEELARHFAVTASGLDALAREDAFDIVINGTSSSLFGSALALPASVFKPDTLAYDMTYGNGLTAFLRQAADAGVRRLHDGVGMLVEQAAEAFNWWRGVRPETRGVIERLGGTLP